MINFIAPLLSFQHTCQGRMRVLGLRYPDGRTGNKMVGMHRSRGPRPCENLNKTRTIVFFCRMISIHSDTCMNDLLVMAIMGNPLFEHDHDFFSAPEGNPYCWIAGFSYDICCVGFGAGSGRGNGGALGASDGLLACVAKSLRSSLRLCHHLARVSYPQGGARIWAINAITDHQKHQFTSSFNE